MIYHNKETKTFSNKAKLIAILKYETIYIIGILLLSSCVAKETELDNQTIAQKTEAVVQDSSTTSKIKVREEKPTPETYEVKPMIFEVGSKSLFTDTCAFYFECDCCSGNLILNSNLSFYAINYCQGDISLNHGSYELQRDTLTLNFDGTSVRKEYNWANEVDTSAIDYFITNTLLNPFARRYIATSCEEKMKLIKVGSDEIGIESDKNYQNFIKTLEQEGLTAKLTELMKKL